MKKHTLAMAALFLSSGCFLTGSVRNSDIVELESRVESLNQRVGQLETGSGTAAASASFATNTSTGFEPASQTAGASRWPALAFSWRGATNKLVRGLTNVITGWVEIPKRVQETTVQSGAFPGFTWGLIRGFGRGFIRTAGGFYETITFPFPAPPGYQPVMNPPYVFICEENNTQPVGAY